MTDPQIDPAGETGQDGGSNPPASSGQQMPGAGSPGQGVPGQASPGQGQGQASEGQGSPGRAGSAMSGASSVGTATRTTQSTSTGVPAQPGEPTGGRARAGREPTYDYGYGSDLESGDIVVDSTLAKAAKWSWAALFLGGLGMIALGICLLVWPHASLTVVAILVGAAIVVSGLTRLYEGFTAHGQSGGMRVAYVVIGLLAILAGVYCLRHHALSLFIVAFLTGVYFIAHGIADIGVAASVPGSGRGLRAVLVIFSIAAGLLMVIWPAITLILFLTLVAAWLLFYGVVLCMLAFGVRRATKGVTKEPARAATMATPAQAA